MTTNEVYKDSHGILEPSSSILKDCPLLCSKASKTKTYGWTDTVFYPYTRKIKALRFAVASHVAMKFLLAYEDGNEHAYRDVTASLSMPVGHDIDCWRSLCDLDMIALSSKGRYGLQYFTITDIGREVLSIVKANQVYWRIARWFKLDDDKVIQAMVQADLNGEESWKDLMPEAFTALLEGLFNPDSDLHRVGSCYRWMNNVMRLLKEKNEFFEKFNCPEVNAWLKENSHYYGIEKFSKKLANIAKKKMKAAA